MNTKLRGWYGLNQDGHLIYLGLHRSIDEADDTVESTACVWIWDEDAVLEIVNSATALMRDAKKEKQAALLEQVVRSAHGLVTCITVNHDNDYEIVEPEGVDPVVELQAALAEYNAAQS